MHLDTEKIRIMFQNNQLTDELYNLLSDLAPETVLANYKGDKVTNEELHMEEEIGVGGFAVIRKGTYKDKEIAVKILNSQVLCKCN